MSELKILKFSQLERPAILLTHRYRGRGRAPLLPARLYHPNEPQRTQNLRRRPPRPTRPTGSVPRGMPGAVVLKAWDVAAAAVAAAASAPACALYPAMSQGPPVTTSRPRCRPCRRLQPHLHVTADRNMATVPLKTR